MRNSRFLVTLLMGLAVIATASLMATVVAQLNLEQLVQRSDRVFVGKVLDITESAVETGGGTIPAVTYRFQVNEAFKGNFATIKDVQIAEVKVVGTLKQVLKGQGPIPGFPVLREGQEYLLMVAPDGPAGLTATMGLGQGCFTISGRDEAKVALNAANNAGLFNGMDVGQMPARGPISYATLTNLIRDIVGGSN